MMPSTYTDIQGLGGLRREARSDPNASLERVAREFESIFVQMMLKSMRDASLGEGIFDSDQSRLYQDLYDKQIAMDLSRTQGLGLADLMVEQLRRGQGTGEGEEAATSLTFPERTSMPAISGTARRTEALSGAGESPARFDSPEQFINTLWPQAERAAAELGVEPRVLLAQAALETGWGGAVIQRPDGTSSHNLFNIKADSRWDGAQVGTRTLEYRDGVAVREHASFRAYDSYEESFSDYVSFLKENPRYREALESSADPHAYVEALQRAGYATDPEYAQKIGDIMERPLLHQAGLKDRPTGTIT